MKVRNIRKCDVASMDKWLTARGFTGLKTEQFEHGYIIPGVCAAFLIQCEGGLGIIDSLVSNPYVSSITRNKAIDRLVISILSDAKSLHINRLIALSTDKWTLERASRHGFSASAHTVISREIQWHS